jgi:hypothetical protein
MMTTSEMNLDLAMARVDAAQANDESVRRAAIRSFAELDEALAAFRHAEAESLAAKQDAGAQSA